MEVTRGKDGTGDGSERKMLPPALRHGELVSYLQTHQGATVTELAEVLGDLLGPQGSGGNVELLREARLSLRRLAARREGASS